MIHEIGDVVLVKRFAPVVMPALYRAQIMAVAMPTEQWRRVRYEVKPCRGVFRTLRWVNDDDVYGVIQSAAARREAAEVTKLERML
jgi:hypothetical protein